MRKIAFIALIVSVCSASELEMLKTKYLGKEVVAIAAWAPRDIKWWESGEIKDGKYMRTGPLQAEYVGRAAKVIAVQLNPDSDYEVIVQFDNGAIGLTSGTTDFLSKLSFDPGRVSRRTIIEQNLHQLIGKRVYADAYSHLYSSIRTPGEVVIDEFHQRAMPNFPRLSPIVITDAIYHDQEDAISLMLLFPDGRTAQALGIYHGDKSASFWKCISRESGLQKHIDPRLTARDIRAIQAARYSLECESGFFFVLWEIRVGKMIGAGAECSISTQMERKSFTPPMAE